MNQPIVWLRKETKEFERRTPLSPAGAKKLKELGAKVIVEKCPDRIIPDSEYEAAGCEMTAPLSWKNKAPEDAIILGLKELDVEDFPLSHRHIYFAHAYKGQEEAPQILGRFQSGNGTLYDLEFLMDENKRRVAAFGHWAGFVGCAIALDRYFHKHHPELSQIEYPGLSHFENQTELIEQIKVKMKAVQKRPRSIVIGAKGRCGKGAIDMLQRLDLEATHWDMEETAKGGPFPEILDHNLFINTVLLGPGTDPFLTRDLLEVKPKLEIIADVSCDPNNENNPIPLYNAITSWERPFTKTDQDIEILAVDNLPSLLPKESSEDFSQQLLPHLIDFIQSEDAPVWKQAREIYKEAIKRVLN